MLIKRIYFNDFLDEFKKYGREDQFSYGGKKALFHYLEEILDYIELDVISICCSYTEYNSLKEFCDDYGYSIGEDIEDIEDIHYYTVVIPIDDQKFIIQDF